MAIQDSHRHFTAAPTASHSLSQVHPGNLHVHQHLERHSDSLHPHLGLVSKEPWTVCGSSGQTLTQSTPTPGSRQQGAMDCLWFIRTDTQTVYTHNCVLQISSRQLSVTRQVCVTPHRLAKRSFGKGSEVASIM